MHLRLRGPAAAVSVRAMPSLRSLSRPSLALALLGALGLGACKKAPDAGTDAPGTSTAPTTQGGTVLRYKAASTKLKETIKVSFSTTGVGGGGDVKVDATGLLDISDAGNGKLKVGYSVLEVRGFEMSGALKPTAKEGQPVPDLKAQLLSGKGARIIDLLGEEDDKASEALPENAKPKEESKEFDVGTFASFLGVPGDLPQDGLVPGKPWKVKKEKPEKLGNLEIDMEIDMTYTLVKIDASSGKRLAEIKIESEASGAKEMAQGGKNMMISLDTASESKIVWNLDDQIPVSSHIEATQAGNFGQYGSGETRVVIDATYEPAA